MHELLRTNKFDALVTEFNQGRSLTESEALQLESEIECNPDNVHKRARLLGHYLIPKSYPRQLRGDAHRKHVIWIVDNFPESALGPECTSALLPEEDPKLFEELETLWKRKVNENPNDFNIAFNASIFYGTADLKTQALEAAQQAKLIKGKDRVIDKRIRFLKELIQEFPKEGTWKQLIGPVPSPTNMNDFVSKWVSEQPLAKFIGSTLAGTSSPEGVRDLGIAWLKSNPLDPSAGLILASILETKPSPEVRKMAIDWIEANPCEYEAIKALRTLL